MRSVRRADNLHVTIVMISGSLIFLVPSGPVQVCTGITLSLNKNTRTRFGTGEGVLVARIAGNKS